MKIGKIKRVAVADDDFTSVLSNIHKPPKELFTIGELSQSRPPCVAIVGTRKPSHYGQEVTHRLAYDLAKAGICVISGLAFGVDSIAHRAALEAGGLTVAILAGGLHRIYPASHESLARDIIDSGGAILSENTEGVEARRYDFLSRNRLISGLADAVLVTEATERSGTLSTANHALEQNRETFAVPGPITSLLSVGPNNLLRQGAHIVTSAKDVLNIIAPQLAEQGSSTPKGMSLSEMAIIELLKQGVRQGDDLLKMSRLETGDYLQALTALEISGIIRPLGGNTWTLR